MKKGLSIVAVVAAAVYLVAGICLLGLQDVYKPIVMGGTTEMVKVYPVHNILEMIFMGIPCMALGIGSMSEDFHNKRGLNRMLIIYSSVMLVCSGIFTTIGGAVNSFVVSRTMGVAGLANMSMVSAGFGWIQFLLQLSLVMLLLRGALKE